jgi:hypothetical protein
LSLLSVTLLLRRLSSPPQPLSCSSVLRRCSLLSSSAAVVTSIAGTHERNATSQSHPTSEEKKKTTAISTCALKAMPSADTGCTFLSVRPFLAHAVQTDGLASASDGSLLPAPEALLWRGWRWFVVHDDAANEEMRRGQRPVGKRTNSREPGGTAFVPLRSLMATFALATARAARMIICVITVFTATAFTIA